jgi:hypothetical protein
VVSPLNEVRPTSYVANRDYQVSFVCGVNPRRLMTGPVTVSPGFALRKLRSTTFFDQSNVRTVIDT